MRKEPLLYAVPTVPVASLAELYALAYDQAQKATLQYGAFATQTDGDLTPVRPVFEILTAREGERCDNLSAACLAACGKRPDTSDLRLAPIDLVLAAEIAGIGNSSLSTPYTAWALATRHRQRAFVFWTYVVALAENPLVRRTAEGFAREALSDGNRLRCERRQAWRAERKAAADETAASEGSASAALLESLLRKDIIAWSQALPPAQRSHVLAIDASRLPPHLLLPADDGSVDPASGDIQQIMRRALRRAEHLSNIYLDDADGAHDQDSMEFAQKLAARSIARLAALRHLASESKMR